MGRSILRTTHVYKLGHLGRAPELAGRVTCAYRTRGYRPAEHAAAIVDAERAKRDDGRRETPLAGHALQFTFSAPWEACGKLQSSELESNLGSTLMDGGYPPSTCASARAA
jgi:hypothetical protein